MAIDITLVGQRGRTVEKSWTSKDVLLYAIAVGGGLGHPEEELEFTTENFEIEQKVFPSFICVAATAPLPDGLNIDFTRMLHAEMSFRLLDDIRIENQVLATSTIAGIYDKGSGALVSTKTEVVDTKTGKALAELTSGLFLRGEGGFGGDRGPQDSWERPERSPDFEVEYETRPEQALLYRLTGDRNPLHTNPVFASKAGFPAPILHGMCSYGFTSRALLHKVANSEPSLFGGMSARFTKAVALGETLTVQIWRTEDGALFRTLDEAGDTIIDRGRMTLR
ncbi:enoyl-CoA hydratase [Paenarthrobacter nitroguajacolicus]|uniref:MaoC family dehydratase n=1 Tax=Paenarthrobacter nitroguajacolicus TaxID=211146 RepID=UPI0015C16707|nr:MaoC family dehydratase [Paenarthrobacter nitroguajacolicus]NWL10280.1 enoyl-CoA hydratase [Paenarthrobacter nitroguajacolicus]